MNYVAALIESIKRFEEAKTLLRKTVPVARRTLGENARITLKMQWVYAAALFNDTDATLDDLREAVTTLEERMAGAGACWWRAPDHAGIERDLHLTCHVSAVTVLRRR